jgi:hypothetical protein
LPLLCRHRSSPSSTSLQHRCLCRHQRCHHISRRHCRHRHCHCRHVIAHPIFCPPPCSVIYCTLQRVHARHRCRAVLQPNDGGAERLLRQAHRVAPRAGERGQGQIGRVGGINNNKGNDDDTHARNNHIVNIL